MSKFILLFIALTSTTISFAQSHLGWTGCWKVEFPDPEHPSKGILQVKKFLQSPVLGTEIQAILHLEASAQRPAHQLVSEVEALAVQGSACSSSLWIKRPENDRAILIELRAFRELEDYVMSPREVCNMDQLPVTEVLYGSILGVEIFRGDARTKLNTWVGSSDTKTLVRVPCP